MNTNFKFPRQRAPIPRPTMAHTTTAPKTEPPETNRESNALRASVLDVALQLGIGNNSTVTNWMFNNSLQEEDEEEESPPGLTSPSTEESFGSSTQRPHTPSSSISHSIPYTYAPSAGAHTTSNKPAGNNYDNTAISIKDVNTLQFPMPPVPPRPVTPTLNKLRKKRTDGYESDGGYVSEGAVRRKRKDSSSAKKKEKEKEIEAAEISKKERKEARSRAKSEKLQEKEEERKRKKSLNASKNTAKDSGYEADSTPSKSKKSKSKPKSAGGGDAGYETDDGGLSKSKSRRFFRLGTKSDAGEKEAKEGVSKEQERIGEVPPVLPMLPIAQRFATTLGSVGASTSGSISSSGSETPLPPALPAIAVSTSLLGPASGDHSKGNDRESQMSSQSGKGSDPSSGRSSPSGTSSSSPGGNHRWGQQFSRDAGAAGSGHQGSGSGSGSHSTLTAPPSAVSSSAMKFPMISYPLTRSSSPSSTIQHQYQYPNEGQAPVVLPESQQHISDPLSFPGYHEATPLATPSLTTGSLSPDSLYVPTTPFISRGPKHPGLMAQAKQNPPMLDTHLTIDGGITGSSRPSPVASPTYIVPSTDYIVPSPTPYTFPSHDPSPIAPHSQPHSRELSPLPSPNVLAYYDIPPASPPPVGPLPRLPSVRKALSASSLKPAARGVVVGLGKEQHQHQQHLHQQHHHQEQGLFSQPIPQIQRGREAPFPAKPVLPAISTGKGAVGITVPGLEERVRGKKYKDLYAMASAGGWGSQDKDNGGQEKGSQEKTLEKKTERKVQEQRQVETAGEEEGDAESAGYWDGYGLLGDEDEDEEDIRDVLDRFEGEMGGVEVEKALASSRSFDALNNLVPPPSTKNNHLAPSDALTYAVTRREEGPEDDDRSLYPDDNKMAGRDTMYMLEHDEEVWGGTDRNSRWSGSTYSRSSVLDVQTSEETRQRFVRRVEAMLDTPVKEKEKGVGRGIGIPPSIPKVPVGLGARPGTATGVGARPKWRF